MAFVNEIRKSVTDTTPYYAAVGVLDLAVEKVREAGDYAGKAQATLTSVDADAVRADVVAQYRKALRDAQDAPGAALSKAVEVAERLSDQAQEQYDALAIRGEELFKRLETQQATQDMVKQYDATVALSKGAVTTAKKAFADTRTSAKATVTTLSNQADKVAGVVGDVVSSDLDDAKASVKESGDTIAAAATQGAKATKTAAKRTSTTARKSAKGTTARTKAANTSARKTATSATKATATGAEKVGDVAPSDRADAKASVRESADTLAAATAQGAKATKTAAKRTSTTARKSAKATNPRATTANTSARKTATRASKATATGAEKVGA